MFASISLSLTLLPLLALGAVHDVQVSNTNGTVLEYSPDALSAEVGDQVVFHFNPKNHTVSQSSFASPCGLKDGGFHSGFMPVAANSSVSSRPTFTVNVTDTDPIWVYCGQAAGTPESHCGLGMVFAINCPTSGTNSFANFKAAALAVGASLSAAAAASATAAPGGASNTLTAAYGDVTLPPVVSETLVTIPITLDSSSTWTTTYTSYVDSPAPTPVSPEGAVHTVVVGGPNKLFFDPDVVIANPRDTIVFQFHQNNHSVTQSSFADPCRPLNEGNPSAVQALSSGFHPVSANATEFPTWNITVNDTMPQWYFCQQTSPKSHCGAGMVFAVNAINGTSRSFSAFQSVAEQLNGTVVGAISSPSATSTTGGALSLRATSGAGIVVALIAVAASFL